MTRVVVLCLIFAACASRPPVAHRNPVVKVEYEGRRRLTEAERATGGRFGGLPPWLKEIKESSGTGFLINGRGDIVTGHHVVHDSRLTLRQIVVTVDGRWLYPARILHLDRASDLAVLHIDLDERTRVSPLRLGKEPREGDVLVVRGYPGGGPLRDSRGTVTRVGPKFVECATRVEVGSSGGPALAESGRVAGVLSGLRRRTWTGPDASITAEFALVVPVETLRERLDRWGVPHR